MERTGVDHEQRSEHDPRPTTPPPRSDERAAPGRAPARRVRNTMPATAVWKATVLALVVFAVLGSGEAGSLVLTATVDGAILVDPALLEPGSC